MYRPVFPHLPARLKPGGNAAISRSTPRRSAASTYQPDQITIALREVAQLCQSCVRQVDGWRSCVRAACGSGRVARWGGEEFVLLCAGVDR